MSIVRWMCGAAALVAVGLAARSAPLYAQHSSPEEFRTVSSRVAQSTAGIIGSDRPVQSAAPERAESRQADRSDAEVGVTTDPGSWRQRLASFNDWLAQLYEQVAIALGSPQPASTPDSEALRHSDPRVERASRGFFDDMKRFFSDRDGLDEDADYQEDRLRGMTDRIDQQFEDVSGLLQDFEEKRYPGRQAPP